MKRAPLMFVVGASGVIGEDFDHVAFRDLAVTAPVDHQLQLGLEGRETANSLLDVDKAGAGDGVGCRAGLIGIVLQREQGADRVNLEFEFAGVADEDEPGYVGLGVAPLLAFAARRGGQQSDRLVKADGRRLHPGPTRQAPIEISIFAPLKL